jgi:hypothetical protein
MGFLDDKWAETDKLLRAQIEPHLAPGEQLLGAVHANEQKTFSAKLYAIGVTPDRLIVVPVNRKMHADGDARMITRGDITGSSVWGWGGGVKEFLSANGDQQIRIETPQGKLKLMVVGGNMLEDALAGEGQLSGLDVLVEFLLSTRDQS